MLHHTNGNGIYNTSHPLLERLTGQLEVEAPCPYNSIPYDYRMSQMWVEGTLGIVPELAPKIMLNEEGRNITLSDNVEMFRKWADIWEREDPFKYTPVSECTQGRISVSFRPQVNRGILTVPLTLSPRRRIQSTTTRPRT